MLEAIGRTREEVYIANILKCRPPGNRDPLPDEIETCTPWLVETISVIQPALIVTLGNFATKYVLQTTQGITRTRGTVHSWHGRTVIPTAAPPSCGSISTSSIGASAARERRHHAGGPARFRTP
jgi:DNA polymerase